MNAIKNSSVQTVHCELEDFGSRTGRENFLRAFGYQMVQICCDPAGDIAFHLSAMCSFDSICGCHSNVVCRIPSSGLIVFKITIDDEFNRRLHTHIQVETEITLWKK